MKPELVFFVASLLLNVGLIAYILKIIHRQKQLQLNLEDVQKELDKSRTEKAYLDGQMNEWRHLRESLNEKERIVAGLMEKEAQYLAQIARINTLQEQERKAHEERMALLQESRQQLAMEFQQLADKLLEQKTERMQEQQNNFFTQMVRPLKDQLAEFRQRVDSVHETDTRDRVKLMAEISQLKSLNQQMSEETLNLTNALKGSQKFQGNWGEFVLDRVLEDSGLRKGFEYEIQAKRYSEDGQMRLPDVIVHLPDNKDLIIDAKVTLVDYQRYCVASSPEEKEQALKAHLRSLDQHVKGLSVKDYESLEGVNSLDFVLLFVPIEAAFLLALESDPELFQHAYDKHIILVSPTTLLATLRTVENLWRYERRNKNAEEIARQAGGLYDQCVLLLESLEDIGKQLHRSIDSFDKTMHRLSGGRGNMISRIARLKQLGAKTKKQLPEHFSVDNDDMPDMLGEPDEFEREGE